MTFASNVAEAVGNTPLIKLRRASDETGCTILGKAEFTNPAQSVKDRAALFLIDDALARGVVKPGGVIVEGTAGNTGIGLAALSRVFGLRAVIVMPDTQSVEKKDAVRALGAELVEVPAVPYANPNNYVHYSRRLAEALAKTEPGGAVWANQFDNVANRDGHARTTAEEIWRQTDGKVDGFVSAVGTGGTLAGVALGLRARSKSVQIALADPPGAALYSYYTRGTLEAEGSSITEGIGQGRITKNLEGFTPDVSFQIADTESVPIVHRLITEEGLCLGGSTGVNIAGAIRLARTLGPGHLIVTMLCDHGTRYQSKLLNPDFLASKSLPIPDWLAAGAGPMPDVLE
ncbi:cysteine synthase A [Hyphomicrobium sp.]|uniref:cysteine synthase A n=1 Tax=Hyphomicrobium sp. TaxID=82 RepID=UPI0025BB3D6C|nr:cysteine synthase A [Hyphomicrobium sp.]MCC7252726.1 cysteine synthase A [Hyphomicrobium sp.]